MILLIFDLLVDENCVVVTFGHISIDTQTGYYYVAEDGCNYLNTLILYKDIEVPDMVIPQKYCYSKNAGFYLNSNYLGD